MVMRRRLIELRTKREAGNALIDQLREMPQFEVENITRVSRRCLSPSGVWDNQGPILNDCRIDLYLWARCATFVYV